MKKRQNDIQLGDAIKELLETYQLNVKLDEMKVIEGWEKTLGNVINKHTLQIRVINRKVMVKLDSAALKNELMYSKSKLVASLNAYVGKEIIDDIIFN